MHGRKTKYNVSGIIKAETYIAVIMHYVLF